MNSRRKLLAVLLLVVMAVSLLSVCAFAADGEDAAKSITCTTCSGTGVSQGAECDVCEGTGVITSTSRMAFSFWALVPPIVAIILALITKEVYSSLFVGILLGALFYSNFDPITGLDAIINDGMVPAVADNAGIMLFLVILGAMVALINRAGGSAAFGRWAETHIKTRVGAMFATFLLGVLIFVDDYFNCLTVGSVMLPVTDRHKISRAKLAYLIDATAAPVCMIAPISSWAAAVSGVVEDYNGFDLFVRAIPYNFYSLLTFVFIIALILMKFDYGPMRLHEMNARFKDDLYTTGDRADANSDAIECNQNGRVIDLILPVAVLIVTCFAGLVYVGGYWDAAGDYYHDFVGAFGNTDAFAALPWGSLIALVFTIIYFLCRRLISFKAAMDCLPKGFINMVPRHHDPDLRHLAQEHDRSARRQVLRRFRHELRRRLAVQLPAGDHLHRRRCAELLHRHELGHVRHPAADRYLRVRPGERAVYHRRVRVPGRRRVRRPLLAHLRHDHHGLCRCDVQPRQPRVHAAAVCRNARRHLLCQLHSGGLHPERLHLPRHRRRARDRNAVCHPRRHRQEAGPRLRGRGLSACPPMLLTPCLRSNGGRGFAAFFAVINPEKGLTFDRRCGIVNLPVSREVPFLCPFGSYREAITLRQGRNQ